MVTASRHRWSSMALGVGLTAACNAILGIEDARLDQPAKETDHGELATGEPDADRSDVADSGQEGGARVDDADAESLCDVYCRTVMANCTGAAAVYPTMELCVATCTRLPGGSPGDQIGNTIYCRLQNAELAHTTGEVAAHCPVAGPGGNGVCGSDCEAYCMLFQSACDTSFREAFLGLPDCVEQCAAIPNAGTYDVSFTSGNTVQCRLYHVGAATADPNRHCSHAAGEPPCAD